MSASNQAKGNGNLDRLNRYFSSATAVPIRRGKANISAIAEAAGVERQACYRDEAMDIIAAGVKRLGLAMPDQYHLETVETPAWAIQRLDALEQQLVVARTEAAELRHRLALYRHLDDHMMQTGLLPR